MADDAADEVLRETCLVLDDACLPVPALTTATLPSAEIVPASTATVD